MIYNFKNNIVSYDLKILIGPIFFTGFLYIFCMWCAVGDSLKGTWHQIQCGNYVLPDERDKETAIDGVFFIDTVSLK